MRISLQGVNWKVIVNGRKSANGSRFGCTIYGTIEEDADADVFQIAGQLADQARRECEMEFADSIQISIEPPEATEPRSDSPPTQPPPMR